MLISATALLPLACSSGTTEDDAGSGGAKADGSGDATQAAGGAGNLGVNDGAAAEDLGCDALIVPEGLSVTPLEGGNGVLEVIALSLLEGPDGPELYAALRNDGEIPACSAAFSVELFDRAGQSLAAAIGGLLTQRFYRLTDGSDTIAACVGPGDVTMTAITDLSADIVVEDVGHLVYRCPYFALDVVPIDGLTISQVTSVVGRTGTAYMGTLFNRLDVAVSNPSVAVFPVNRVGRPLGVASGSSTIEVPPGGSWAFETNTVGSPGVDHVAYPAGALPN